MRCDKSEPLLSNPSLHSPTNPSRALSHLRVVHGAVADGRAQLTVAEAVTYKWKKEWGGEEVFVVGNDTNWTERLRMERDEQGDFVLSKSLPVGQYKYKFLVDGEWKCSPDEPTQVRTRRAAYSKRVF
eukprot:8418435-Pyramimonas_sp.AAC.1